MTYLTPQQVSDRFGINPSTLWRWHTKGDFPKPVKFSEGCARFSLDAVQAWEASKAPVCQPPPQHPPAAA
ncbi:helix-turn-helix transcriptional regulator [Octadecabacter dasysiphoniae]|uniref:helix-turn-helix transcriptional regulator n=1 Tax=Octadecabacter dasysiphoniae TaxID=2909341 RepID=UPI003AB91DFA